MKERLIELLQSAPTDEAGNRNVGAIADYLLANGVIAPPCRMGDQIFLVYYDRDIRQDTVLKLIVKEFNGSYLIAEKEYAAEDDPDYMIRYEEFGKQVFTCRETAEDLANRLNTKWKDKET